MCHVSCVMCHVSCVMCHVSRVTSHTKKKKKKKDKVVKLVGGGSVINRAIPSSLLCLFHAFKLFSQCLSDVFPTQGTIKESKESNSITSFSLEDSLLDPTHTVHNEALKKKRCG